MYRTAIYPRSVNARCGFVQCRQSPAGSEVEVIWSGRRVRAFVPALLEDRELALDVSTAARAAAAATEVGHAAEALDPDIEPLARLLLRAEGVASSYIEGVTAPVVDIVLAEEQIGRQEAGSAAWVASNLAAVTEAAGLVLFRVGDHLSWIKWFADVAAAGGRAQRALAVNVELVKQQWRDRLDSTEHKPRSDAAVFASLDLLPRHIVLTSQILADELGISRKAALDTLHRLSRVGILIEHGTVKRETPGQPASLFVSPDLLGLSGSTPLR
jgi:hypothetical protein